MLSCSTTPVDNVELPFFRTAQLEPEWINRSSSEYEQIHTIAEFSFLDQEGRVVNKETFAEKIFIANFFFTICPGICPVMTENLIALEKDLKKRDDLLIISHTVTPWIDSVAQLKKYAEEMGVNSSKHFLVTGNQEEIYELARKSYFAEKEIGFEKDVDDFLHSENLFLIDKQFRIRGIYNGTSQEDIKRLKKHISRLK